LLALQRSDVDWDNFTLKVRGKGGKHRLVPISLQLRKALYRHLQTHTHSLLLCSRGEHRWANRISSSTSKPSAEPVAWRECHQLPHLAPPRSTCALGVEDLKQVGGDAGVAEDSAEILQVSTSPEVTHGEGDMMA
jgi:integrase